MCPELEIGKPSGPSSREPQASAPKGESLAVGTPAPGRPDGPSLPPPSGPEQPEKPWQHFPNPAELSLAGVHDTPIHVDNLADTDPQTGDQIWEWVRTDLQGEAQEVADNLDSLENDLYDLHEDGVFEPDNVLDGSGPDQLRGVELNKAHIAEVWEAIANLRAGKLPSGHFADPALRDHLSEVATNAEGILIDIEGDYKKLEGLREKLKEREDEGYFPDCYMNWIRPLPDHVPSETYAKMLEDGQKDLGFGYCCEIIQNQSGDPYLLLTAGGMDLSDEIVKAYVAMGMCPTAEIAKGYISSWGHQQAKEAMQKGDPKEIERVQCLLAASVRSLDTVRLQAERSMSEAASCLDMLGFHDHEAAHLAQFPNATTEVLLRDIQGALEHPEHAIEGLTQTLKNAGPYRSR